MPAIVGAVPAHTSLPQGVVSLLGLVVGHPIQALVGRREVLGGAVVHVRTDVELTHAGGGQGEAGAHQGGPAGGIVQLLSRGIKLAKPFVAGSAVFLVAGVQVGQGGVQVQLGVGPAGKFQLQALDLGGGRIAGDGVDVVLVQGDLEVLVVVVEGRGVDPDRKSTRLNSSH